MYMCRPPRKKKKKQSKTQQLRLADSELNANETICITHEYKKCMLRGWFTMRTYKYTNTYVHCVQNKHLAQTIVPDITSKKENSIPSG